VQIVAVAFGTLPGIREERGPVINVPVCRVCACIRVDQRLIVLAAATGCQEYSAEYNDKYQFILNMHLVQRHESSSLLSACGNNAGGFVLGLKWTLGPVEFIRKNCYG
jgi:hypothetical protein